MDHQAPCAVVALLFSPLGIRWFPTNFFPHFPTYVIDTSSNANEVIEQQSAILFQAVELAKQNACASGRAVPKCRDFHGSWVECIIHETSAVRSRRLCLANKNPGLLTDARECAYLPSMAIIDGEEL